MICKHCGCAFDPAEHSACPRCFRSVQTEMEQLEFQTQELEVPIGSSVHKRGEKPQKPHKPLSGKGRVLLAIVLTTVAVAVVVMGVVTAVQVKNGKWFAPAPEVSSSAASVSSLPNDESSSAVSSASSSEISSEAVSSDPYLVTEENALQQTQYALSTLAKLYKNDCSVTYQHDDSFTDDSGKVYYAVNDYNSLSELQYAFSDAVSDDFWSGFAFPQFYESDSGLYVHPEPQNDVFLDFASVQLKGGFDDRYVYHLSIDCYDSDQNYLRTDTVTVELTDDSYVITAVATDVGGKPHSDTPDLR